MPITKHNFLVTDAAEIPRAIAEAFHLASTGRPGPVLVDIPKDVLQAKTDLRLAAGAATCPATGRRLRPHGKQIREAAKLIAAARRPVLYVGGGVLKAEAVRGAAAAGRADRHPGRHHADGAAARSRTATRSTSACPACTAPSPRSARCRRPTCSSRSAPGSTTGSPASSRRSRPGAKIVHADIDPAEIGKNRRADVPIVGDAKRGDRRADRRPSRPSSEAGTRADLTDVVGASSTTWRDTLPARLRLAGRRLARPRSTSSSGSARSPARTRSTPRASASTRCGRRSSSSTRSRGTWLNSGGLGTMGYAVPAAMGAKVGRPGRRGLGDRRRRLLPDDQPGARHLRDRGHPDQGRRHQQRQPGHGPAVADPVLRRALLQHRPRHAQAPHPGLRDAGRGAGLRRAARASRATTSTGRSRRRWRSTTARSSSTSWSARTRRSGRWSPPAPATTRSWPPAASGRCSTATS